MITNYLDNRLSVICFDGNIIQRTPKIEGSPRSILGSLLFIIFINDLCFLNLKSNETMFADDTTLYLAGTNLRTVASDLEIKAVWL